MVEVKKDRRRTVTRAVATWALLWGTYTGVTGYLSDDVVTTAVDWMSTAGTFGCAALLWSELRLRKRDASDTA